jgi:hypothetical protein
MTRVHVRFDSMDTPALRAAIVTHRKVTGSGKPMPQDHPGVVADGDGLEVTVEGPEAWGAVTNPLPCGEAIEVLSAAMHGCHSRGGPTLLRQSVADDLTELLEGGDDPRGALARLIGNGFLIGLAAAVAADEHGIEAS